MGLIIKQGKQDISNDKDFSPIISAEEVLQITKIAMHKTFENTLEVTYKVIGDSKYKGRNVWDNVNFDPKSAFAWKYRNLRKAAGVPYAENEPASIDIEALLLNKAVKVELNSRKGNDGNEYQNIKYKTATVVTKAEVEKTAPIVNAAPVSTKVDDIGTSVEVEDINPFENESADDQLDW